MQGMNDLSPLQSFPPTYNELPCGAAAVGGSEKSGILQILKTAGKKTTRI